MKARRLVDVRIAPLVLLAFGAGALSQPSDVPQAPRIGTPRDSERPGLRATTIGRVPDRARLAPLPEERSPAARTDDAPDEIVVIGESEWRLPDLGSAWRAEQEAAEDGGRIQVKLLPLYDPEAPPLRSELFFLNPEQQRLGFIELFRVRFGRRSTD